ncbi:MAG TPA: inositol monophosphatase family protein [Acidimicrobiales bacterium]|nr:inositol monophosphatase family protein [Acidimicrobiales bacterium]
MTAVLRSEEIERAAALAEELAREAIGLQAGRLVGRDERSTKKGPGDWVTVVDVETERHVRRRLAEAFPDHAIEGEELGSSGDPSAPTWYLDPIDGTSNFVHGLPWSSFSLALADAGGLAAAVVADPHRDEIFSARRGGGARRNDSAVACSEADTLEGGLVLTELLGTDPWPGLDGMLAALAERACVTRIPGSTALSLASFAAGRAFAVVLANHHPIDVAGGMLLALEAGGEIIVPRSESDLLATWVSPATTPPPAHGTPPPAHLLVVAAPGVREELCELLARSAGRAAGRTGKA